MDPTHVGNLEVVVAASPNALRLALSGQADSRDGHELYEYLLKMHNEAIGGGVQEVRVDVKNVAFMNSSSLSAFVGWVGELQKVEVARRYLIYFEGASAKRWQLTSFRALAKLAPEQIHLAFD